jgi:DNA-binding NarL/FixJ family response regulator
MSQTRILGLMHDLFFRSKVDAVAHAAGIEVVYAASLDEARARCADGDGPPAIVFVDLADPRFPAKETAEAMSGAAPGMRLIGFASHVDLKALGAAKDAGFEMALSRSDFTQRLPDLLKS